MVMSSIPFHWYVSSKSTHILWWWIFLFDTSM